MPTIRRLIGMALFIAILASACAPAAVTPAPTEPAASPTAPPPTPTAVPAIREVVDADRFNPVIETFLGFDPAYQDPRMDCADMTGNGVILGDTGQCIPAHPQAGFCIEGSFNHPCDILLVAIPTFINPFVAYEIGGMPGYTIELMEAGVFEREILPLEGQPIYQDGTSTIPAYMFLTAIPASSVDFFRLLETRQDIPLVGPPPDQIVAPDRIQEVVEAQPVNHIIETLLGLDSGYTDPRIACDQMQGSGMVLGDTGLCIPQYPEAGFCVEGSRYAPCDMVLFAEYGAVWDGEMNIGGRGAGYVFRFTFEESFENEFPQYPNPEFFISPLIPAWNYLTVIPASSANIDDMGAKGMGLIFAAPPGP